MRPAPRATLSALTILPLVLTCASASAQIRVTSQLELNGDFKNAINTSASNTRDGGTALYGGLDVQLHTPLRGDYFAALGLRLSLNRPADVARGDSWVQVGNRVADLKLGRFEAMDLFPLGKDVALEAVPGYRPYLVNRLRGRADNGSRQVALGLNLGEAWRAELSWMSSQNTGQFEGLRTGASYQSGPWRLRGGVESVQAVDGEKSTGLGFSAGYVLDDDVGFNLSFATIDKDSSLGLNASLGALGLGWLSVIDDRSLGKSNALYAAYTMPLTRWKGAVLTPGISLAKGDATTEMQLSTRVRLQYPLR